MLELKEIVSAIEAMEQQRIEAVNEANDLKVKVWQLESKLEEKEKEVERWKNVAFSSNTK